jgi:glycosyltransferase involved in cell wall biosynthesis
MRIAWISYLDSWRFGGGGELNARGLLEAGRERGHVISESSFLSSRVQRVLRQTRLWTNVAVDWDADVFLLANIRNAPELRLPFPKALVDRVLSTGRAAILQDAWVDICPIDVPCGGDKSLCPRTCNRTWGNWLFGNARFAIFLSPLHRDICVSVLDQPLNAVILSRPYVDTGKFRDLGLVRDIDVLYVGTIKPAKGYYNLLDRFGADRITFAGTNALGHPLDGTYLGHVDYAALPELYNRARIFAHLPEWYEPLGRTVVEAALCGCEVVTNDRVGAASYDHATWSDPEVVERARDRFWLDFEAAAADFA